MTDIKIGDEVTNRGYGKGVVLAVRGDKYWVEFVRNDPSTFGRNQLELVPKRFTVEVRPPKAGETYWSNVASAWQEAGSDWHIDQRPVIVIVR